LVWGFFIGMLGRRYTQSPETKLMNRQARDKAKLTGRCDGCVNLHKLGDIPHCSKDRPFFGNRFEFGERCDKYLHTR